MAWRIHLTNQAIQHLHILPSKPPTLAVWSQRRRVYFYNFLNGTPLNERVIPRPPRKPRASEVFQSYITTLTEPDGNFYLPHVPLRRLNIYCTDDGKLRVYVLSEYELYLEVDGSEERLAMGAAESFVALDLDRALGMVVALDATGKLHIYQQSIRVGAFDIGFSAESMVRPSVAVSRGGGSIYASDGQQLVVVDSGGSVRKRLHTHYDIGRMTCSPGGGMVLTSDMQAGVLRAYQGDSLTLTHQKFAIDLVAAATQTQLLGDLPPMGTAISAIAAYSRGRLVFAMSGVVCVTDVTEMDEIPRPKALL